MKWKLFFLTALLTKVLSMTIPEEANMEQRNVGSVCDGENCENVVATATSEKKSETRASTRTPGMIVYLPNYTLSSTINLEKFDFTNIDVAIYCFFRLDSSGNAYSSYESMDYKLKAMERLNTNVKANYPKLRTLLSFGGGSGSKNFGTVLSTEANIKNAAKSITKVMKDYGFDGIDIDWEFPENDPERESLYQLIKKIRSYAGEDKLITISSSATASKYNGYLKKYVKYADWFNIMTYNYAGGWNKYSGHNSPLYTFTGDLNKQKSVDSTVSDYKAEGVPDAKIVVGAAFNGREWKVTSKNNNGLNQPGTFIDPITYKTLRTTGILSASKTPISPWVRTYISSVKSSTLFNPKTMRYISYEDTDGICERAAYVKKRKLGGLMVWELGQDYNRELTNSAVRCYVKY